MKPADPRRFSNLIGENAHIVPSILSVTDYFAARAPEVLRLYNSLKPNNSKIPRHLRRRMRSFRPYNLRPKLPKGAMFPRNLSRRTRRKHRMYLNEEQSEKTRLPATHLWHAKRFKMDGIWGMRLPLKVNDKGRRGILRLSRKSCLIHDRSYMDCWRVSINDDPKQTAAALISVGFPHSLNHDRIISGERMLSGMLRIEDRTVSSMQAWYNPERGFYEIHTHPSARQQISELLKPFGARFVTPNCRFELIGARSDQLFLKVFGAALSSLDFVPGLLQRLPGSKALINVRACGTMIEIFMDEDSDSLGLWRRLAQSGGSPIGVLDRHDLLANSGCPDFPFDFPDSLAGASFAAVLTREKLKRDNRRPRGKKMDATTVESAYFPDWTLIGLDRVPVSHSCRPFIIRAERLSIRPNAHVYMHDKLVGYVTSSFGDCNDSGLAHLSCSPLSVKSAQQLSVRNPGCQALVPVTAYKPPFESTDSLLLGMEFIS
jgi:hypothetical protein